MARRSAPVQGVVKAAQSREERRLRRRATHEVCTIATSLPMPYSELAQLQPL